MKNLKKRASVVLTLAMILALTVTSFAVFTDRFQSSTTVTAGTLDLGLTQDWANANAAVADVFKPGTGLKLDYTLTNNGNLATDVRETFAISVDHELTNNNPEFDLYKASDVTLDAEGNVTKIADGATPLATRVTSYTANGETMYKITYTTALTTLNGAGNDGEVVDGISSNAKTDSYVLVFNTDVDNDFQNVNVTIDYMAEGLQHFGTGAKTWEDAKVLVDFTFGGETVKALPALN